MLRFKAGERLFESHQVRASSWKPPVLKGEVADAGETFFPGLNLRSTVFVDNRCTCPDGRKRKVCAHAVAVALHFQAAQQEAAAAKLETEPEAAAEPFSRVEAAAPEPRLRSLALSEEGTPLRLLVFLPPNLEQAAQRQAIVVKLDAAVGRQILPLNRLSPTRAYATSPAQRAALRLVEAWCGGKLAGLLQLTQGRLRALLDAIAGEPLVYWVKRPQEPIVWEGDRLPGVHEFLQDAPDTPDTPEADAPAVAPESAQPQIRRDISLREKSKANPRRAVESRRKQLFQSKQTDYPRVSGRIGATAASVADAMEGHGTHRVVVDGSPNFLAVRLPAQDESIRPLREILKGAGFTLEPTNRKWWLRDRHKTLNFLAGHWRDLKDRWQAAFTENFESKFKNVELSALKVEAREESGQFALQVTLSEQSDEMALRKALAGGKSYVDPEAEGGGGEPRKITLLDQASVDQLHQIERAVSGQADRPFTPTFSKKLGTPELIDVEELIEEVCEGWQPPQAWQSRSRALKQVAALEPAPVRPGFDSILRSYQRIGVAWLWHLYRHELGGILADEMGLGKTLQALALIECIRTTESKQPALVVCPASLVENWQRETARFTPGLRVLKHHGPKRAKEPVPLENADLVITSYGTLRQDAELLTALEWSVVVGDEAQHIKNRRSQNARTLTRLRSAGRFLLTGTPVENSLDDLISLFAFLMPGY